MKIKFLLLIFIMVGFSCRNSCKNRKLIEITNYNFEWMVGNWIRTNGDDDKRTVEHWEELSSQEYVGYGYTTQNGDTISKENLRIAVFNEKWNLEVTGVNEHPTHFLITSQIGKSFVSENKRNEFPKSIEYSLDGNNLVATISDNETEIQFIFSRLP